MERIALVDEWVVEYDAQKALLADIEQGSTAQKKVAMLWVVKWYAEKPAELAWSALWDRLSHAVMYDQFGNEDYEWLFDWLNKFQLLPLLTMASGWHRLG